MGLQCDIAKIFLHWIKLKFQPIRGWDGCLGWGEWVLVWLDPLQGVWSCSTPFIVWLHSGAEMPNMILRVCNKRMPSLRHPKAFMAGLSRIIGLLWLANQPK